MIKAIIFDCFGVLVGDGFDVTYRTSGGDPIKDTVFIEEILEKANRAQISTEEFRRQICQKLGISAEKYTETTNKTETINYELLDYIKTIRPKYKTAILSNVNRGGVERRIPKPLIEECFDAVVVSGDVGYIKPEREIYELTAERLGVKLDECVFIDDRQGYVAPAVEYGMMGIVYQDFAQMKTDLERLITPVSDN